MSSTNNTKLHDASSSKIPSPTIKDSIPNSTKQLSAPPPTGINTFLPPSWVPYSELMRLEKPAGLYAFFMPFVIGTVYAASLASPTPTPSHLARLCLTFLVYSILSRGAACTWNDNIDQAYDRQVARGAVSTSSAHIFAAVLAIAAISVLPHECAIHILAIGPLWIFCPFAKRITHYPQLVLGFPFAWAILVACSALNVDAFSSANRIPTSSLFAANVAWTIIYDTIYAHQDLKDDVKAGIKSMAVRFAKHTELLVAVLGVVQVALLVVTGVAARFGPLYFAGTCLTTALTSARMLWKVNLSEPASCAWYFRHGFFEIGGSMVAGVLMQYFVSLGGLR